MGFARDCQARLARDSGDATVRQQLEGLLDALPLHPWDTMGRSGVTPKATVVTVG